MNQPNDMRRRLLRAVASGATLTGFGCCNIAPLPKQQVFEARDASIRPFLRPPSINKLASAPNRVIDVHTHLFNASDVTVKGYLEGPVAHSNKELRDLIKLLAPVAEKISVLAPSAKDEYYQLKSMSAAFAAKSTDDVRAELKRSANVHRQTQSREFFKLLDTPAGRPFREKYNAMQAQNRQKGIPAEPLNEDSLYRAGRESEIPLSPEELREKRIPDEGFYAEGVLAFIRYMLSYRWGNLLSYQEAYSVHGNSVGVDRVVTALVDFDRWLECPPRSSHEDQMQLFDLISRASGGYVLPLIGYNPWTDDTSDGGGLKRVGQAVHDYGFVGAKIYPPNGFLPYGPQPQWRAGPDPDAIRERLEKFWDQCIEWGIPVMAHSNQSMGSDSAHDELAGPKGWIELVKRYGGAQEKNLPKANLGHFGGYFTKNDWTETFARAVMAAPGGRGIYGDLGYWDALFCARPSGNACRVARHRLKRALAISLGNDETVADRVMYGSDWLMLSQVKHWSSYARALFDSIREINPTAIDRIFARNALRLFPQLKQ